MEGQLTERISLLPDRLVDQIAAGEVVERPASVIKELIENSLDAAAKNITVEVIGAGSEEILVADDGLGMTPDEIEMAVRRHATSKIRTVDDLAAISTFGFRGEALPSIASVSRMEIISRVRGSDAGARRYYEGGTLAEREVAAGAVGTRIRIKNLFYNTPARKKFLKTAPTETKRIIEVVTSFATAFVHLGFKLTIEGKTVINTPPADTSLDRMADLFGRQLADKLLAFSGGEGDLLVSGFVGKPELARRTRDQMTYFVNGRRVQSRSLHHAVSAGYGEMIPKGRFPFAVVFIEINPQWVDVNVHPTKREVRFIRENQVHDLVYYTINRTLHASVKTFSHFDGKMEVPSSPTPESSSGTLPLQWKKEQWERPQQAAAGLSFVEQAFGSTDRSTIPGQPSASPDIASRAEHSPTDDISAKSVEPGLRPEIGDPRGVEDLWQFNNLYIMARVGDDLMVIDQHTMHERILYEAILAKLDGSPPETQRVLFPESVELEAYEYETFEKNIEVFIKMGFAVRPFGPRIVLIEGAPSGLRQKNPVNLFRWVLDDIVTAARAGEDIKKRAAASYACRAAVMAGDSLTLPEMRSLFRRLFECKNPFVCPHGRPTLVRIPMIEFDKKFCRRK